MIDKSKILRTYKTSLAKDRKLLKNFPAATLRKIAKANSVSASGNKETILERLARKKVVIHVCVEFV